MVNATHLNDSTARVQPHTIEGSATQSDDVIPPTQPDNVVLPAQLDSTGPDSLDQKLTDYTSVKCEPQDIKDLLSEPVNQVDIKSICYLLPVEF